MTTSKKFSIWLMKSEPSVFSFEDLVRAPGRRTCWEGVRNYQARNFLRDSIKLGDRVLFYHSNTEEPAVMGVAEVVREGYEDPAALDPKSPYFDEKAKAKGQNPWFMVDVKALLRFAEPVTRARLAAEPRLKNMMVLKRGARLSVQPVTLPEFETILELGAPKKI